MNTRNLPFMQGAYVYGVPYEKAVALLTANPAKILGIDQEVGTLEVGKKQPYLYPRRCARHATIC